MLSFGVALILIMPLTDPGKSPQTSFEAEGFTGIHSILQSAVQKHRRPIRRDGVSFHMNHPWVRDNIHMMKGAKYWDEDLDSFIDAFIETQHDDGFFYEIIGPRDHDHLHMVGPKHKRIELENNLAWIRLELEPDIEYHMVEAAYTAWQATGNLQAMKRRLPALTRGLKYMMSDPTRWDAVHQLVKRTFTIDTWDFTYGVSDQNRRIEPDMPMAIMHGDNSGLYAAWKQLAEMYEAAGDEQQANRCRRTAAALRERVNRVCWNGRFYTHQIHLTPIDTGVDEEQILSLSNVYDINRKLPTHDMAVRIIDEYQSRRIQREDTHFAEWFSIDPPYPTFFRYKAGEYINGGIASFVAGELAKAAFEHGRERYGADILRRLVLKIREDGTLYFLYTPDGKNQAGGPSGWGGAAVLSAMYEGLAGIRDDSVLFREITVSPRFIAADIEHARICTRYGPSDAYISVIFDHDTSKRTINLMLSGVAQKTHARVLLPENVSRVEVITPQGIRSRVERVEASPYVVFDWPHALGDTPSSVTIEYTID